MSVKNMIELVKQQKEWRFNLQEMRTCCSCGNNDHKIHLFYNKNVRKWMCKPCFFEFKEFNIMFRKYIFAKEEITE